MPSLVSPQIGIPFLTCYPILIKSNIVVGQCRPSLGVCDMPEEKREKQEVPEEEKQEVPEVLRNLQDTFNFYFKDEKEKS